MPVALNIANLSNNVTFATLYNNEKLKKMIIKKINKKFNFKFFIKKNFKEIKKNRFIDIYKKSKFFEFYEFNNCEFFNSELEIF